MSTIISSIDSGNCSLVIGPRHRGKSYMLKKVAKDLKNKEFYQVAYIDMSLFSHTNNRSFFQSIFLDVYNQIDLKTEPIIPGRIHSSSEFQRAIFEIVSSIDKNLVIIIDDLEFAPPNLIALLLGSLRSIFTSLTNVPGTRFQAVVCGTINFHQLALEGVSRFESISDLILVDDISPDESRIYVEALLSSEGIRVSDQFLEAFLSQTGTDRILIKLLANACVEHIKLNNQLMLDSSFIHNEVKKFLSRKLNFEIMDIISQIEGDPDLLSCLLMILEEENVSIHKLPLQFIDSPNALDLCGVFQAHGQHYSIKSPLWMKILRKYFSAARCGQLYAISGYWGKAIEYYGMAIHKDKTDKKSDLFTATINALHTSLDEKQAISYLAQGLNACYPDCEIAIYLRSDSSLNLEHYYVGKNIDNNPPINEVMLDDRTCPEVDALFGPDYSVVFRKRKASYLLPIRVHSGSKAIGLVSFCERFSRLGQYQMHEEIMQMISFLNQSARAIEGRRSHTKVLSDARDHAQILENLDKVLTNVLNFLELDEEVIFRLLLGGLTSGECLGFNRAALFLYNPDKEEFVGTMGVGHLTRDEADCDWKNFPHHSIDNLINALMSSEYQYTPLHSHVKEVKFTLKDAGVFGKIFKRGIALQGSHLSPLVDFPALFVNRINPVEDGVVAPLTAGIHRLGVIYVDNKFTNRPVDEFHIASLVGFLSQAALVIEMARSLKSERRRSIALSYDSERRQNQLEAVAKITPLIAAANPDIAKVYRTVLRETLNAIPKAHNACIVERQVSLKRRNNSNYRLVILPPSLEFYHVTRTLDLDGYEVGRFRMRGIANRVIESGIAEIIPNVQKDTDYFPAISSTRSELCVPIPYSEGAIVLESDIVDAFTHEDLDLVKMLATHVGIALHNDLQFRAQSERQTRERVAQIATGIVHDINNIVSNIPDVVDELRKELYNTQDREVIEEVLNDLQYSAKSTHRISSRLREFITGGEFKPVFTDLNLLIQKTIQNIITSKPDHVQIDFEPCDSLPNIQVDELWMEQVFSNLIHNSFEAIPPSRRGLVTIGTNYDQKNIIINIQDNGSGIPEELLGEIFEPGFTTKREKTGLHGVGLFHSKQVVTVHNGNMQVESIIGSGTIFTINLPIGISLKDGGLYEQ